MRFLLLILLIAFCVSCTFERKEISPLYSSLRLRSRNCFPKDASYGAVTGQIFLTNHQPISGSVLYLGEYVGLETSNPLVILDPSKHLNTQTDENGIFCFSKVPPGRYGLIVWNAAESVLLPNPSTGYSLILEIKPGKAIDVGILYSPIP